MEFPQSAHAFISFMENVWGGDMTPTQDDGVMITVSPLYDTWHDARRVARYAGIKWLYGSKGHGEYEYHYDMPDGSRVAINTKGSSIREINKHA